MTGGHDRAHHGLVRNDLPTGTVTFLFTDVEGSTRLLREMGAGAYGEALAEHRRIVRAAATAHGGVEVDTQGDAFLIAFPTAPGALTAAQEAQTAMAEGPMRVRMGLHTGTPILDDEGYVGADLHRAARIAAAGHGGQVLVSAATAALLDIDRLHDLGVHRFKDLSAPERVFQLGNVPFPPLRSLHQTNLPIAPTPFLGRGRELAEVIGLLSRTDARLLTLTGPAGTGKTRLAMQAAAELEAGYGHGVWWIPLGALRDPELVLETAAGILGAKGSLADHVGDKAMLLLFDNFEQVVAAAVALSDLLATCPNLELLVTSREPLHLSGEQEYPVPPLAPGEGVDLFVARARAARPDFVADAAVAGICRRLDDLPLALELAAAQIKALSPESILARLEQSLPLLTGGARDLPERQRTLRGAIAWSHELVGPAERRTFANLAVFRGGCTLEAAEAVADADLETLGSLVDKSLLRQAGDRFSMLSTIREFAAEQLDAAGAAVPLRNRHAAHFLTLAEEAEPHLHWYSTAWLDRLELEHDNLRAALDWFEESGEMELALRLAGALPRFWDEKGHLAEGRRRVEGALRLPGPPTAARANALTAAADMAVTIGDAATAQLRAEEALAIHRALGDPWGTALSGFLLGLAVADNDDLERARQLFDESARLFHELGDAQLDLTVTRMLAWMYYGLGDRERGRTLHEENLVRARMLGREHTVASTLGALAMIAVDEGRLEDAVAMQRESHRIRRDLADSNGIVRELSRVARVLAATGTAATAARLLARAEALHEEIGARPRPWLARMNAETLESIRMQLDHVALAEAWAQGRLLTVDEAVAIAFDA
jgi:predicted ATPase/class 3 adenylate cyclase